MQIVTVSLEELEEKIERAVAKALLSVTPAKEPLPLSTTGNATRQQAANFFNVSLPTLNEWTKTGKVKGQRINRRVLYRWADLDAALTAINTGGK